MGSDKATLPFGGEPLAARVARALEAVAYPVRAVGHVAGTELTAIDDAGEGPLVALVAGAAALPAGVPVLVLACDLPFVDDAVLTRIVRALGDADAAVPVVGGRDQPLCACYAPRALRTAAILAAQGKRAMRDLVGMIDVTRVTMDDEARALLDVDTPEALAYAERILDEPE
jgi:molybdopterin-guanine dinucleotide biosynthesis protein A